MANMKGYKIDRIYKVWHFDNVEQYDPNSKTGGVFTEYINTFLKMKQEASGWPSWCIAEIDKQKYIGLFAPMFLFVNGYSPYRLLFWYEYFFIEIYFLMWC